MDIQNEQIRRVISQSVQKYGRNIFAATLIYFTISWLFMLLMKLLSTHAIPTVSFIVSVFSMISNFILYYGLKIFSLKTLRGDNPGYGELFSSFTNIERPVSMILWQALWYVLWGVCFLVLMVPFSGIIMFPVMVIVIGIFLLVGFSVLGLRYSQIYYLLYDNPEMTVRQVMRRSIEMMKGNKKQFFFLILSKLWWMILIFLGIGVFFTIKVVYEKRNVPIGLRIVQQVVNFLIILYSCFIDTAFYQALIKENIMFANLYTELRNKYGDDFNWMEIQERDVYFINELNMELDETHPLYRKAKKATAKCESNDDVLFLLDDNTWAIVHLTYSKCNTESSPESFPHYTLFADLSSAVHYIEEKYKQFSGH